MRRPGRFTAWTRARVSAADANGTPGWSTAAFRFSRVKVIPALSPSSARRVRVRWAAIHIAPVGSPVTGTTGRPSESRPVPCKFSRGQPSWSAAFTDSSAVRRSSAAPASSVRLPRM